MNRSISKSSLFIIELMISVLFFSLCSAVCLTIFAKAHKLSMASKELSKALDCAQMAAECVKENPENILLFMKGESPNRDLYLISYDKNWRITGESEIGVYFTKIVVSQKNSMMKAVISVMKGDAIIYETEVKKYVGQTGSWN